MMTAFEVAYHLSRLPDWLGPALIAAGAAGLTAAARLR